MAATAPAAPAAPPSAEAPPSATASKAAGTLSPGLARRLTVTLAGAAVVFLLVGETWRSGLASLLPRVLVPAAAALAMFSLLERWPRQMPARLPRWLAQVLGATFVVPLAVLAFYIWPEDPGRLPFWQDVERLTGFLLLTVLGMLVSSWVAMGALVRHRDAAIRDGHGRELALQRQVAEARLQLLQAQVQPHFLFNTLANVQALVDAGSPRASPLLAALVAYLRAAVPRLADPAHTLGQELEMVRAYLALMQMRMPDRLRFAVEADPALSPLHCPPLTLLTLVENAVRHGIDPSLEGGRIDIRVAREGPDHVVATVCDTGIGLAAGGSGLGTGLATLQARLQLAFGDRATLALAEPPEGGVQARITLRLAPADRAPEARP